MISLAAAVLTINLLCGVSAANAAWFPDFEFGEAGAQGGQLAGARGIAVNEAGNGGVPANTVYVAEFGNNRISSFDADGSFIRAWGWDVIADDQPNDTGAEFEICEVAAECKAGADGPGAGQFASAGIAGGIAVNQATGDVYAVDRGNNRIQQFAATGAFVRAWGVAGSGAGEFGFGSTLALAGIGIDAAGGVYVADAGNARVQKFDSEGNFLAMGGWEVDADNPSLEYEVCTDPADCQAGTSGTGTFRYGGNTLPSFLAVSLGGEVYAVGKTDGTIYRLDSGLAPIAELASTAGSGTNPNRNPIATNGAGNILFGQANVAAGRSNSDIFEVDPVTDTLVASHKVGNNQWVGLAVNAGTDPERLYGTRTTTAASVNVFENLEVPISTVLPATDVGGTKATLHGTVNPIGIEVDECRFEYTTATSFEDAESVDCAQAPGEIGDGTDPVPVQADIEGLTPNTLYRFRLTASNTPNGSGPPSGPETFTTAETVVTEPASGIAGTEATLHGSVNPDGVGLTDCVFEYGTTTAYGQTAPCVPGPGGIGAGEAPVAVQAEVALDPGTVYHFRLAGAYDYPEPPVGLGADEDFQTLGPVIASTWSEDVAFTEATLKAEIDPEGKPTTYRFEYGTQGPCGPNPCAGVPIPDGAVGDDSDPHLVSEALSGLAPDTTYHYRVIATNPDAENEGPDRSFATYAPLIPKADCPNQAFRVGPAATLPDCRAYEMVSPLEKNGGDIVAPPNLELGEEAAFRRASRDGARVTFVSPAAFGDAQRSSRTNQYLASRGEGQGWRTHALYPPQGTTVFDVIAGDDANYEADTLFQAFTPDLCLAMMKDHSFTPLRPEAIHGYTNLYLRDNCGAGADGYEALTEAPLLSTPPANNLNLAPEGRAFSREGGHVAFAVEAALDSTPAADPGNGSQIYARELGGGPLRLVSALPGGEASPGNSFLGSRSNGITRFSNTDRAVSADGSRIFWTSADGTIYVRIDGEETVQVSGPGATFWTADLEGSTAIYSQDEEPGPAVDNHLFEFDVDSEATTAIAGEVGGVLGAGEDLGHLYFTSREDLAEGAGAGEWNVYLRRGGEFVFVATVSDKDRGTGQPIGSGVIMTIDGTAPITRATRVTPDGRHLAFMSNRPLTGYDNADAVSGEAASEVFLYDADAGELACASCKPSGARPAGRQMRGAFNPFALINLHAAAWIPTHEWTSNASRVLAEDGGRLYFNAFDALVPEDVNGAQDVYQWEAPGVGDCATGHPRYAEPNGGCLSLISTGRSGAESALLDASANGSDVFFTTSSSIDPRDVGFVDLYDARVGGGFPPPPPPPPPCVGDACQPIPTPPEERAPASASFRGPGDPTPGADCGARARRAVALSRRAKRTRLAAKRSSSQRRGKQLRRRSARFAAKAKRLSGGAKRCRRQNGRAGR